MTKAENYLRAMDRRYPEWVPCWINLAYDTWMAHKDELKPIIARYPDLFENAPSLPDDLTAAMLPKPYALGTYTDSWGCVWENAHTGAEGQVVYSPLKDDSAFAAYKAPSLDIDDWGEPIDWEARARGCAYWKEQGQNISMFGGRLFDRMYFLRGFNELMMDFGEENEYLTRVRDIVWDYQRGLVQKWIDCGNIDELAFHTDFGTQTSTMISPAHFRKYLKPMFADLFGMCKQAGIRVRLSSDGNIVPLADDLAEAGVTAHDPQFRACGLENIAHYYLGKIVILLDLDRQMFEFCTPQDIDDQVRTSVGRLYRPEGGLMVFAWIHGNVPAANIEAIAKAMEKYCIQGIREKTAK
ncbi:MAG: hypothetical protein FWF49_03155 [Oscillospiraceae bacterium]|nr:hypothetical protein [Oscillospiraceae bacterium]